MSTFKVVSRHLLYTFIKALALSDTQRQDSIQLDGNLKVLRQNWTCTNFPTITRTKNFPVKDYSTSVAYSFVKCVKLDTE